MNRGIVNIQPKIVFNVTSTIILIKQNIIICNKFDNKKTVNKQQKKLEAIASSFYIYYN